MSKDNKIIFVTNQEVIDLYADMDKERNELRDMLYKLQVLKSTLDYKKHIFWRRVGEVYGIDVNTLRWEYHSDDHTITRVKDDDMDGFLSFLLGGKEDLK